MYIKVRKYEEINKVIKYIIYMTMIMIIIGTISSCNKQPIEKVIYVPVKDTITEKINNAKIAELENKYNLLKDSFNNVTDSLNAVKGNLDEDLFVAKYKLGRIKYYNDVAAKGNNLKYLRGWINRVLNE